MAVGWLPRRRQKEKQENGKTRSSRVTAISPQDATVTKIAERLAARVTIMRRVARREAEKKLGDIIKFARIPPPFVLHRVKPEEIWREAQRAGGSGISYYAAETVALTIDNEVVTAAHNRALALRLLERAEREAVREVCRRFRPLLLLPEGAQRDVLARLGFGLGVLHGTNGTNGRVPLPLQSATRVSVYVSLRGGEDEATDPEILELFEDDQAVWEANGEGKRGNNGRKARLATAGLIRAGVKTVKAHGSAGKREGKNGRNRRNEFVVGGDGKRRIGAWRWFEDGMEEFEVEEF